MAGGRGGMIPGGVRMGGGGRYGVRGGGRYRPGGATRYGGALCHGRNRIPVKMAHNEPYYPPLKHDEFTFLLCSIRTLILIH